MQNITDDVDKVRSDAVAQIWLYRFTEREQSLMLALATNLNANGEVYTDPSLLAWMLDIPLRDARLWLTRLVLSGYVRIVDAENGMLSLHPENAPIKGAPPAEDEL